MTTYAEREKWVAYHEAAHAFFALVYGHKVHLVSIETNGEDIWGKTELSFKIPDGLEPGGIMDQSSIWERLVIIGAGPSAQLRVIPLELVDDWEKALGPLAQRFWSDINSDMHHVEELLESLATEKIIGSTMGQDESDVTEVEVDDEEYNQYVRSLASEAADKVGTLLDENWDAITNVADSLRSSEKRQLSGEEVLQIIRSLDTT